MNEITFSDYIVTCQTPSCGNGGIPIPMLAPSVNPDFMCGVCEQTITSIETVTK
jgi:hypothetical protein